MTDTSPDLREAEEYVRGGLADEMPDVIRTAAHQRGATWATVAEHVAARLREITRDTR